MKIKQTSNKGNEGEDESRVKANESKRDEEV